MSQLKEALETIAKLAPKASVDEMKPVLAKAKSLADAAKQEQLSQEITAWLDKVHVIFKEPVARQGMAKHARYWMEKLSNV